MARFGLVWGSANGRSGREDGGEERQQPRDARTPFWKGFRAGLLGSSWISICRPNGGLEKMEKMMEEEIEDDRYLDLEICIPWLLTNTFRRKEEEL